MAFTRRLARPLLASVFVVGGVEVLRDPATAAVRARALTARLVPALQARGVPAPQDPATIARAAAGVQLVAAAALATGRLPRTSSVVLAAILVPSTVLSHPFWAAETARERRSDIHQTAKNASLLGGLVLAAVDTEGKPGLAWRARRAAKDVKREARQVARTASLEARLAATHLPGAS